MSASKRFNVFISHASEDKNDVARPLARLLAKAGLTVWIDEAELTLGDSLRRKIDQGLATSRFGVVILSATFFAKEWPQKELDALVAREDGKAKVILPVWHKVTAAQIAAFSPLLADKLAISTARGLQEVADAVLRAVNSHEPESVVTTSIPVLHAGPIRVSEVLSTFVNSLEARYVKADQVTGLRTGFVDFDSLVSGLKAGELHVLASRPAMGSTALALKIVENVARAPSSNVLYFSPHSSSEEIIVRIVASVAKIPAKDLKALQLSGTGWQRFVAAIETVNDLPIFLDHSANISMDAILERSRFKAKEVGGLHLIVIDALHHIADCESPSTTELALRQLRLLARELECPILVLLPVLRAADDRISKRPLLSDVYCQDGVERYAYLTLFLYRDEYYNSESSDGEVAELIVAKNCGGATGMVKLKYDRNLQRFENLALVSPSAKNTPDIPF